MARIEKFLVRSFSEKKPKSECTIKVPLNAIFLNKVKVLPDGIYAFYSVLEIIWSRTVEDTFIILGPDEPIPEGNFQLVDILDIIYQLPPEGDNEPVQGMLILPVYKEC